MSGPPDASPQPERAAERERGRQKDRIPVSSRERERAGTDDGQNGRPK